MTKATARANNLSDSEWTTLINLNTLLNRCHLMGGSGAVESKSNITSRLRQYNQTVDELNRVAEASNVLDLEVQAFARCARNRMVRDKASYLCEAVLNADALSPRTEPSTDVRHRLAKMFVNQRSGEQGEIHVFMRELDSWLNRRPPCGENQCELEWFRRHHADFPIISRLARRILSVNSTSTECERMFSIAGNCIGPRRTRLRDDTVENLVEYRAWWEYSTYDRRLRRARAAEGATGTGTMASASQRQDIGAHAAPAATPRHTPDCQQPPSHLCEVVAATATRVSPPPPPSGTVPAMVTERTQVDAAGPVVTQMTLLQCWPQPAQQPPPRRQRRQRRSHPHAQHPPAATSSRMLALFMTHASGVSGPSDADAPRGRGGDVEDSPPPAYPSEDAGAAREQRQRLSWQRRPRAVRPAPAAPETPVVAPVAADISGTGEGATGAGTQGGRTGAVVGRHAGGVTTRSQHRRSTGASSGQVPMRQARKRYRPVSGRPPWRRR
eukprot:GHVU01230524.1.p1 GENE.GHVU01230524.1~~GHVU01230524.1.p1  ORF type:complete len:509 (+),score=36.54 GHVU01230524.1:36-1529(+)